MSVFVEFDTVLMWDKSAKLIVAEHGKGRGCE